MGVGDGLGVGVALGLGVAVGLGVGDSPPLDIEGKVAFEILTPKLVQPALASKANTANNLNVCNFPGPIIL